MSQIPNALWLNVSPPLQRFDRPLLKAIAQHTPIAHWAYSQNLDEPVSLEVALVLLHDYLKQHDRPIHLLGHSTGGLLGLLYAQRYPERVRSLTLLAVGVNPVIDWQAHYYTQRRFLPCDQPTILRQMVYGLLGCPARDMMEQLIQVLQQDLYQSLSPHHLGHSLSLSSIPVKIPLLVCGSMDDIVIDPNQIQGWKRHFYHTVSRLWLCSSGRYFFHYFHPQQVSEQIIQFFKELSSTQHSYSMNQPSHSTYTMRNLWQ
jgi:pimeloyl-ACP methyl ester carboxylesterase